MVEENGLRGINFEKYADSRPEYMDMNKTEEMHRGK
jgi:hypothetical protein